ncbi:MAG: carbonic anhydrase [Steroidobacteraceae bacterium]
MRYAPQLFVNNKRWARERTQVDPEFFTRLCGLQAPDYMWIGCADSRVPANEIVGLAPGEMFVHRNIANIVPTTDVNCHSVVQYAVDTLGVEHIIVCGHYECGGVRAALGPAVAEPLESWLQHLRMVVDAHRAELDALPDEAARWRRLCELNVLAQVRQVGSLAMVRRAWDRGQKLYVHGWIYDLHDGLLRDLGATLASDVVS